MATRRSRRSNRSTKKPAKRNAPKQNAKRRLSTPVEKENVGVDKKRLNREPAVVLEENDDVAEKEARAKARMVEHQLAHGSDFLFPPPPKAKPHSRTLHSLGGSSSPRKTVVSPTKGNGSGSPLRKAAVARRRSRRRSSLAGLRKAKKRRHLDHTQLSELYALCIKLSAANVSLLSSLALADWLSATENQSKECIFS